MDPILAERLLYNSRDNYATRMLFGELEPELRPQTARVYEAFMGLQGALLGVQMRGIRVDSGKRKEIAQQLATEAEGKRAEARALAGTELFGEEGGTSPKKLQEWLYGTLGLRTQRDRETDKPTTNEDTLVRITKRTVPIDADVPNPEKGARKDTAAAVSQLILDIRDLGKQIGSLKEALWDGGRMRTTLVAAGTKSFRLASRKTWNKKGFNQQNVDKRLRGCYVPDPGFRFAQPDQSKAESLTVAYLANDQGYIDAHEKGNPHINVARMVWPHLDWSGDIARDLAYAEKHNIEGKPATRAGSDIYRISKVIQHGRNYGMTGRGIAYNSEMKVKDAEEAGEAYFARYPGIPAWQESIRRQIKEHGYIQCPGGFGRIFFGPRDSLDTWREALSFIPQAVIAWTTHLVLTRLFYSIDGPDFQVLGHGHDALLMQFREGTEEHYRAEFVRRSRVEWPVGGRTLVIPWKWKSGDTWAAVS